MRRRMRRESIVIAMLALMLAGCSGEEAERAAGDSAETGLYTERLPDAEQREYCGEGDSAQTLPEKNAEPEDMARRAADTLTEEEEQKLQDEAMTAAGKCAELYRDIEVKYPGTGYSYVEHFSDEQRENVVKCLGEQGYVSVSDGVNMENYREMEEFYAACISGDDGMITVYNIYREGDISARTFVHRDGKMQSCHVLIGWQEGGMPEVKDRGSKEVVEIKLTEKGYFIYTYAETVMHGNLREYYRVKPLPEECRELTKKYIEGLSFVNYGMLAVNWDDSNVEEILTSCMFEDICRICTGERPEVENGRIAAETYERIMTTCFPVSVEQVREHCGYQADTDSYGYEMACSGQFPPFGEVVDYTQNEDGTITLYVDGVWPDYNSDCAFRSRIVVQPFGDGTFRYLSNFIEAKELALPGMTG